MTFADFVSCFYKSYHVNKQLARVAGTRCQREGQLFANMLHDLRPDLAEGLIGSALDPFYKEEVEPATWTWVEAHWGFKFQADLDGDGPWAAVADV